MCGACGSGTVRAPWETAAHGDAPRDLAARAREAQQLLGGRGGVTPFGPAGFVLRTPTGAATVHASLDELLDRVRELAHPVVAPRAAGLGTFVARAYVARHGGATPGEV